MLTASKPDLSNDSGIKPEVIEDQEKKDEYHAVSIPSFVEVSTTMA